MKRAKIADAMAEYLDIKYNKLYVILVLALTVRVACFLYYQAFSDIRTFEYEMVAVNLIKGNGFMFEFLNIPYRAGIAPVFPALCAFVYFIFGHHHFLIVFLQILFSVATCALVFIIAKRVFDSRCAYLAAVLAAFHPALIIYSSTMLHSFALYSFLIFVVFYLLLASFYRYSKQNNMLLGICTGLCVLERPTFLPFFISAWICLLYYSADRNAAKRVIISSMFFLLIIVMPWVVRNTIMFKQPVFIQTNQWIGLWIGNNPQSLGTAMSPSGKTWVDTMPDELRNKLAGLDEMGQMRLFKAEAIKFITDHPSQFIERTLKKLYYFWWFSPTAGFLYPSSYLVIYKIYYAVILFGAVFGFIWMFSSSKMHPFAILLSLLLCSYSLLHSIYYLEGRHRFSIEPFLLILFSYAVIRSLALRIASKHLGNASD